MLVKRWIGLSASVICGLFCGLALAFNVYAVSMKQTFRLTQTQVELLGSFTNIGFTLSIVGSYVFRRFGYRLCYILTGSLLILYGGGMWLSTQHTEIFRERLFILCLFQLLSTAASSTTLMSCIDIGIKRFPSKHSGKIIGLYMAAAGCGKIYYSLLFEFVYPVENKLRYFFVTLAVSFFGIISVCFFLHTPPDESDVMAEHNESLIMPTEETPIQKDQRGGGNSMATLSIAKRLLTSVFFQLTTLCFSLFQALTYTFMNNITGIGVSIGMPEPLYLVYVFSAVIMMTRIVFGLIYDRFSSQLCGTLLLMFSYATFLVAMLIGLFCLNNTTIYLMAAFSAIGSGSGFTIPVAMMTTEFGRESYLVITGCAFVYLGPLVFTMHIVSGLLYDHVENLVKSNTLFCKECFDGTYILLIGATVLVIILKLTNIILYLKRKT